jgi:hypothetical protein
MAFLLGKGIHSVLGYGGDHRFFGEPSQDNITDDLGISIPEFASEMFDKVPLVLCKRDLNAFIRGLRLICRLDTLQTHFR